MLRPFLFVGVGGSGGKTLRALKQTLQRRLRQNDWEKGIPQAWQFLQVDTAYDGVAFPAPMLPLDEFVGLVGPGQTYQSMIANLETKLNGPSLQQSALAGWCFPSSAVPISTGAGMIRTIGRTVSASGLANLRVALDTAVRRMQAPGAEGELNELSARLHKGSGGKSKDPVVIVVSSIAGGSGAGMLLDVTETIKSLDSQSRWLQSPQAFLYTPEVFDSIPPALRAQIPMNALGAMAEIMAGNWADSPSEGSEALFTSQGVKVQRSGQKPAVGPNATYLIGSRNSNGVNLAEGREGQGMDEVFMAVGEALTGLVTNERISDDFDAYFLTNVFVASGNPAIVVDHSGLTRPGDDKERMPFGS
ncbi:MAG: tubulin-like doman-containing protein, partial [Actinomycetes bacterium]